MTYPWNICWMSETLIFKIAYFVVGVFFCKLSNLLWQVITFWKSHIWCCSWPAWPTAAKCSQSFLAKYCVQYFQLVFWQQSPKINLPTRFPNNWGLSFPSFHFPPPSFFFWTTFFASPGLCITPKTFQSENFVSRETPPCKIVMN